MMLVASPFGVNILGALVTQEVEKNCSKLEEEPRGLIRNDEKPEESIFPVPTPRVVFHVPLIFSQRLQMILSGVVLDKRHKICSVISDPVIFNGTNNSY